ncbi:hypothetical protein RF11_14714 [Thelohanellus kitauei]|uniref:Uncharacterized protein n=1 Tax=Thelohanellus kitauei TaxID=669202 RepID=A0A0C2MAB3_THEKT|nr:hypothetical protein RF11_14714 [Thelohanellus kitauei]
MDKNIYVVEGLPRIFLFYENNLLSWKRKSSKSVISHNGGKNCEYLNFKNIYNTPCESVSILTYQAKCVVSILPSNKSLSSVIQYSPINPMIMVAPCIGIFIKGTISKDNIVLDIRLMISEDDGFS